MMRGLAYLLWTSAVLAAICVRIDAKNTKKGKKKSNRPRNKEARASVSAEPDSNVPNVSLTSEEMCDACRVTIDEYGSSLLEKWNDPQLARAGPSQKQIDGNRVATQLCDTLNVKYRDYVVHGCRHLVRHHYEKVFVPFSGRSSSSRLHPDQEQQASSGGGGGAIDAPFLRRHKASACNATQSCPGASNPRTQDGARRSTPHEATEIEEEEEEVGDDPQAYGDGACGRCRALVALADSVTRRRRPDPSFGPTLSHLFGDALETGLCESVGLRFKTPRLLEALCEKVLDDRLDQWATSLASYRVARQSGRLPLSSEEGEAAKGVGAAAANSVDGDGYLDETLAARLCGAEGARMCTHVEVEAIFEAQKAATQQNLAAEKASGQDTSGASTLQQPKPVADQEL